MGHLLAASKKHTFLHAHSIANNVIVLGDFEILCNFALKKNQLHPFTNTIDTKQLIVEPTRIVQNSTTFIMVNEDLYPIFFYITCTKRSIWRLQIL